MAGDKRKTMFCLCLPFFTLHHTLYKQFVNVTCKTCCLCVTIPNINTLHVVVSASEIYSSCVGRQDITTYSSGTVDHMAPETLKDGKLHRATDVFSFSILLYEMITRKHPFGSMEPAGILVAIVEGMRPRIPYNCPPEIARMMKACWHHNWQSRPSFGIIVARLINIMTRPINAGR